MVGGRWGRSDWARGYGVDDRESRDLWERHRRKMNLESFHAKSYSTREYRRDEFAVKVTNPA